MIVLLRHLNLDDETYIKQLAQRIAAKQDPSGAWKLFYDEPEGNLSATIECYYALLLAGYRKKDDPEMIKAREFILAKGGPREAGSFTKIILALTGHFSWNDLPDIPVEIVLLPTWAPVNFYDLVGDVRVHAAPILICASKKYLLKLPDGPVTDPSVADLTGRTLEFLGNCAGMSLRDNQVKKAVQWLLDHQQPDGSWYGRWGVTYICGTWSAVIGLMAVGFDPHHMAVKKAAGWLLSIQNPDGGWGESCLSDSAHQYIPLGFSTPTQTAWALHALIAAGEQENPNVAHGVGSLLQLMDKNGIEAVYPTGGGFAGRFYIHYHSHRYVWPLVTCSRYLQ